MPHSGRPATLSKSYGVTIQARAAKETAAASAKPSGCCCIKTGSLCLRFRGGQLPLSHDLIEDPLQGFHPGRELFNLLILFSVKLVGY